MARTMADFERREREHLQRIREHSEKRMEEQFAERDRRGRILAAIRAADDRRSRTTDKAEKERLSSEIAILSSQL